MTLEQVSYLSQTVAAAAVVVSIIYLAIQIRQTERSQRVMAQQARTDRGLSLAASMESPHHAAVWVKVTADNADLSDEDVAILTPFLRRWALILLDARAHHAMSLLSDEAFERTCAGAKWGFSFPITRALWAATVHRTFPEGDAAVFEALAVTGVPLATGASDAARVLAAREALLTGA